MGVQAKVMSLDAAADYLGTGAIEVPEFEREIFDVLRRSSIPLQRIKPVRATGHPHRYFEQTALASAAAVDPRNLTATSTGPTRVERPAFIKAVTAQSNLSLFDKDVTEQQGQFASVVAKDVDDIISAVEILRAQMFWAGTDTSMSAPTTLQWMGGLSQITQQFTVANGASIIDGLKTAVANMVANQTYVVRPSAIYVNPLLADYIDQEAKASRITLDEVEVVAGVTVAAISTQVGKLPLVGDPYMPTTPASTAQYGFAATPSGLKGYYAAILMETEVEIPYISGKEDNPLPRLFQLGLVGNLAGQFVGVKFDTVIFKGPSYAHAVVQVIRP
ncbi:SU10 major capsid protein [Burkholderia multivorans]|uniref:SU10 major capsid protein n=1 Tax=Burkholderia multivorans TaxID=87883 RepID=UPI0021BE342A|nr:hypothetical protein [Burkholderia multivorans]MDR9052069.1 hypothetical protein [Burkholderia multivorans]MDR9060141.1 hypothetical protein [Burkholderia multivorans]MDR9062446.1 hypothetical protein [Burkholderia multivorans]MDR9072206.1 hypothetical protein [Burkholderia multivorans]MDR9076531.1 hypothetical protein [Burkholderia multivorans]